MNVVGQVCFYLVDNCKTCSELQLCTMHCERKTEGKLKIYIL